MDIRRIHPYVEAADPEAVRDFYVGVFGLEVAMDEPVVGLVAPDVRAAQLVITPRGMETPQPDFGIDVGAVAAVDAAHERVEAAGLRVVYPLTDEPWGVRRFFFEDPEGSVVNVLAHGGPT